MRYRKLTAVLAASAVLALGACGSSKKTESTTTTAAGGSGSGTTTGGGAAVGSFKPIKADTLTIVTSLPGPGFWNGSESDVTKITSGYEYELAKDIQQKLGLKNLDVRNENFDAIVAGQAGNFDLALSQVTITPDRAKVVDFTTPYFDADQGVLVKKGTTVKTLDDAKKLLWGIQTSTTGADLVNDKIKPSKSPQAFQNLADAFTALDAGQVDAVMMDTPIVLKQASDSGGKLEVAAQFKTGEQYGGILPKGSANAATINALLKGFKDDGTLTKLYAENFGTDPSKVPVIPLPGS